MAGNGEPDDYLCIVILAGILAVFTAYGIGANDVANAFSTSVGSKTLTMRQAVVFAGIFEFLGAVLFESHVVKTVRKGIADVNCFVDDGELLMYGMMCVIFVTGCWLVLATAFELPVSTTHSNIGGIIGMTMTARGSRCVIWKEDTDKFSYIKGVAAVVLS
uniref:Phosphate transporter n=1 Tax=Fibrocapsa japonica TaxID=94617 RepID=A0A7S2Y0C1_9STRA|mmetsp:Transcript_18619/g.26989  ORF Transcript_18619/g.26989 Transcript_18619/m.26989 type:complete len:161 (+) Transcript_18619:108-590(+)|eukprot:CAMPEP_0113952478 /NCGR_PEP_ID=MMETSP1339-20121228/90445_1 /TAXON_ID=94617 /ORGANISM="Fibrocapsa japonica" /LENGTH=160 /DNA_ID=CAMNT_0000961101 /DNA_START=81 /DNA_END=563 /DNA_ORIENTATION=- /assembly_acc=CAM_ASM_000762